MDEQALNQIVERLNHDRNLILRGDGSDLFSSDRVTEDNEKAILETQQNFDMRLKNRELLYLKKVESALSRIKNKEFGICESCGAAISMKRLLARPTAELCINCKEDQERQENQRVKVHKSLGVTLGDMSQDS